MTTKRKRVRRKSGFLSRKVMLIAAAVIIIIIALVAYQLTRVRATRILLATSMGDITIELYTDMPFTSFNFKNLTQHGIYDGTIFHRVVHDFVVQGGDATSKNITVPKILDELPNKHSNVRGSVAMAKTKEANSATSQFYINLKDNSANLDSNYSVFGRVVAGMDVVDAIGNVATDTTTDRPLEDVTLISAELVE